MKANLAIPFNECEIKLYLTLQDIDKLKSLKHSMEANTRDNYSVEDANTAYCLIVNILNALEKEEEKFSFDCPRTYPEAIWPDDEEIDFSKVQSYYTCEQKGEGVPEGTPIDNSNHTYFTGDERKFNWDIANAITHLTKSNTVNYDDFTASLMGSEIIIRRKS